MSGWDSSEHGDVGGASLARNIRHHGGGDLYEPVSLTARGTNPGANQAGIYRGVGSPPPSSLPNGGPPPLLPEDDTRQPAPPAQGEDPSFDAKVAAEFFRLRDAKASLRDNDCGRGGTQGAAPPPPPPPPPGAFESDVERAMRELEVEAGLAKSASGKSRYSPPTSRPPASPPPAPAAASARPDLSDGRAGGDEGSSLLSHMDMRRVSPGGGKGRPGGLRGMWDNGGGSEGHSALYGAEKQQQQTQRHGPGLKGMWGGEQPEESARPKRQGPGLRGLWSGPDMAAADAARSESQAAYMSALNRDAQEKRAFSDDPQGQQQRLHHHQRQQARVDQDGQQYSPYSEAGGKTNGASEPGTSLVGIGTPRGGITPRQQRRREYFEGADGVDSFDRAADRAKKAAYAEELRKQMAEKEARMAMDEHAPASGRRRASTGGRRIGGGSSGGAGAGHDDGYNHAPSTPASRGRESYPGHGAPDSNGGSPFTPADGANDRWPSAAWSTPPPDSSGSNAGEGRVTAARRRLVEDVYGGGGMGAALGGAGYRRASTGTHGVRSASAGSPGDTGPEQVGVGGRGESTAFEGADGAASQGGSSYLRTGAGVQNLRESERSENKLQKRAAALEQQRALEAQIAARARAKKEEEDKRKREEEEEARQQREQQRRLEADAEEGRRRKQAEQQEQLEGLYRQQEAALRKKRGGGGRHLKNGEVGRNSRAPAYGGSTSALDDSRETPAAAGYPSDGDVDVGRGFRQRQTRHQQRRAADIAPPPDRIGLSVVSGVELETPRRRSSVSDVDDLPAGAQARAQVLRNSPPDRNDGGGGGLTSTPRAGSASSSARRGKASPAASAASGRCRGEGTGLEGTSSPVAAAERVRGGRTSTAATAAAFEGGVGGGGVPPPAGPPLQTRSLLVPVSSASLFPPFPADISAADADAGAATLPLASPGEHHRRRRPMQQSFAVGSLDDHPVAGSFARGAAAAAAAEPPQDEMDAFVTKWQDEHLRRRGFQVMQQRHRQGGGTMLPGTDERDQPSPSPGGRTVCRSPARSLLGGSRARGHAGADLPGGNAGGLREVEKSLAATSRMVNPPSLPRPPPSIASRPGESADAGDERRAQRRIGGGGKGEGEDEGETNLSEQSLTSDSILFYLSGQQREAMAEAEAEAGAGAAAPSSPTPAAERFSAANGAVLRGRSSGISASRFGLPRESSEADAGGERAYGWESKGGSGGGTGDVQGGASASSPRLSGPVQREEGDGDGGGQMSPLTRLLAETPVRLKAPGGLGSNVGAHQTAEPSFGSDPQARRLVAGGHDGGTRTRHTRPAAAAVAAAAEGGSPDAGEGVVGAARRARALWGRPSAGGAAGGGAGVAIAEALTRRGMPWDEMSASEGRVSSSSGAPPLR